LQSFQETFLVVPPKQTCACVLHTTARCVLRTTRSD